MRVVRPKLDLDMTKAKVYHEKKQKINYNSLEVIYRIEQACNDISNGAKLAPTALKYDLPAGTLRNRYFGHTQSASKAHLHEKLMDDTQEQALVDWMMFLGMTGRPISRTTLWPKCVEICGKLPGKVWVWRFMKRHPELKLKKGSGLDPKRAQAFNYPEIKTYFERLMKVIKDNNIP